MRAWRVCVCGSRHHKDYVGVYRVLDKLAEQVGKDNLTIVAGCARGADDYALQWAKDANVKHEMWEADWKKHKLAAGPIRNKQMVDSRLDMVIAFPGGKGTRDMVKQATKAGVKVIEVK